MKTRITLSTSLILFFVMTSCQNETALSVKQQIIGTWNVVQITTVGKNDPNSLSINNLSESKITIKIIDSEVEINKNFELHKSGNYNYSLKNENYLNPEIVSVPLDKIIEFDNAKYKIVIGGYKNNKRTLQLVSYKGIEKQLFLEEK